MSPKSIEVAGVIVSWLKWGILRWVLWQGFGTNALVHVSPGTENI